MYAALFQLAKDDTLMIFALPQEGSIEICDAMAKPGLSFGAFRDWLFIPVASARTLLRVDHSTVADC